MVEILLLVKRSGGWQRITGGGFALSDIARVDYAVGVNIGAEISVAHRDAGLPFDLPDVGSVDGAVPGGVAEEKARADTGVGQDLREAVGYAGQQHRERLNISHAGKINRHGVAGKRRAAGDAAGATGYAGVATNDVVCESENERVPGASAATFYSRRAGER